MNEVLAAGRNQIAIFMFKRDMYLIVTASGFLSVSQSDWAIHHAQRNNVSFLYSWHIAQSHRSHVPVCDRRLF